MNKEAGEKLLKARKAKGLKQQDVADKLAEKLSQTYSLRQYQKMEDGDFPKFKKEVVKQLDNILNTSLYEEIYEQKDDQFDAVFARRILETLAEGFTAQAKIMERMEKNMARQDSQAKMQEKLEEITASLADSKEVDLLAAKFQEEKFAEIADLLLRAKSGKKPLSSDAGKKRGENDGGVHTPHN